MQGVEFENISGLNAGKKTIWKNYMEKRKNFEKAEIEM